jgi:SAM-dependent methyltransferase
MNVLQKAFRRLHYTLWLKPRGAGKPVPAEALDREYQSGAWDHFWGPDELARHEKLLELILSRGSGRSLLDLGCGSGRLASMLKPEALRDYLGLDLSEEGLKKASALGLPHGRFIKADYTTWLPSKPYDIIVFNESLGYAPDPCATALRYAGHLNPGGCLVISHFRWGNHAVIWKKLSAFFDFPAESAAANTKGQVWDLKILVPKAA